jgi:hypothetical protein
MRGALVASGVVIHYYRCVSLFIGVDKYTHDILGGTPPLHTTYRWVRSELRLAFLSSCFYQLNVLHKFIEERMGRSGQGRKRTYPQDAKNDGTDRVPNRGRRSLGKVNLLFILYLSGDLLCHSLLFRGMVEDRTPVLYP